jgi:hypothetical protein
MFEGTRRKIWPLVNIIKIITKRFSRNPTKARMPVVSPINKISIS